MPSGWIFNDACGSSALQSPASATATQEQIHKCDSSLQSQPVVSVNSLIDLSLEDSMSQFPSVLIENRIHTLKIYHLDQTPLPTSLLHNYYLYNTMNIHGPEKAVKHGEL